MSEIPRRILGRTRIAVPFHWRSIGTGAFGDESWCALEIGIDVLERRGDQAMLTRLRDADRTSCDMVIVQGVSSSDIKVGWPMHRLQQLRDQKLCKYFAIEIETPLDAEWIAANAPVHAIVAAYTPNDMAIRYRAFEGANAGGVAIISRANTIDELRLQLATPQIIASITELVAEPFSGETAEAAWNEYKSTNCEPAKLRLGHPPEYGS